MCIWKLSFSYVFYPVFGSEKFSCDLVMFAVISFLSWILFVLAKWKTMLCLVCWGSCSLVIDGIQLSCLHTCGWCLPSCMTSKGGSVDWHLDSRIVFSVLGWARSAALAEFLSCSCVCADLVTPSCHSLPPTWRRLPNAGWELLPLVADVHKTRSGEWQFVIFIQPLMVCNMFLRSWLMCGWSLEVCSMIQVPLQ